jgi:adenosine kinase
MHIVVTGSIAFDYLMSFPGRFTEHLMPEHVQRVSLSFLVDTMDKRRGGCGPNIAYTLALLGERPRLMATAGQDFPEYRQWLEAAGVDTSLVLDVPGKFTASACVTSPSFRRTIRRPCCSMCRSAALWASRSSSTRASSVRG